MPYYFYDNATGFALFKGKPGSLKLVNYEPFESIEDSLKAQISVQNQELSSLYKSFIKSNFVKKLKDETLYVPDLKLSQALRDHYEINCLCGEAALEVFRYIQGNIADLIPNYSLEQYNYYYLALSHSFSRYRIQFNAESIDTMIIQSVSLLDDAEKEINVFMMRLQEWAVWTFPEAAKIISDHRRYALLQTIIGGRKQSFQLPEVYYALKEHFTEGEIAEMTYYSLISLGSDITDIDADKIQLLAKEVLNLYDYQDYLNKYVIARMEAIAPNLAQILTPLTAARMLAKAGSLLKLAKMPASTIQIIGAEKALFLTLKTREKRTPKHGIIYNCSLVQNAPISQRGKMSRIAAQNAILAARVDCLSEKLDGEFAKKRISKGKCELISAKAQAAKKELRAKKLAEYIQQKGEQQPEMQYEDDEARKRRKEERKAAKEAKKAEKYAKKAAEAETAEKPREEAQYEPQDEAAMEEKRKSKEEKHKDKKDKHHKDAKKKDE